MSAASRYRRVLMVLEKWPTDPSKGETRDIAVLLRKRIGQRFLKGEMSEIEDPELCDRMITSLENICADNYKKQYEPLTPFKVGSLGLDCETVHAAVSEEMLASWKQDESDSVVKRTWRSWFGNSEKDKKILT